MANSSSTGQKPNLDRLPDLAYYHIFQYLDLASVWKLRLVSKQFSKIVKDYEIYELCFIPNEFYHNEKYRFNNCWFSTTKHPKLKNRFDMPKLLMLINPSNNLLNLKRLRMEVWPLLCELDNLNKFTSLQILEIEQMELVCNHHLHLNELQALSINVEEMGSYELAIDAPKLHSLGINCGFQMKLANNKIKFNHPLSVKYLRVPKFDSSLLVFNGLKCLEIRKNLQDMNIHADLLKFSNLEKLRINCVNHLTSTPDGVPDLNNLFDLKSDNLEVVLYGVKIQETSKINEYRSVLNKIYEFQIKNYGALEDLSFVDEINYSDLMNLMPYYQPADLLKKYSNIQKMIIDYKVDESRLISFISKCNNLSHLNVRGRSSLDQSFYDRLPAFSSLSALAIHHSYHIDITFNFEFIMKMPYLTQLRTNQNILLSEGFNLNNLEHFRYLQFKEYEPFITGPVIILKRGYDKYEIIDEVHHEIFTQFSTFDGISHLFESEPNKLD